MKVRFEKYYSVSLLLFVILASLVFSWPFFKPDYFTTDDGQWAIVRLAEMVRELKDGEFPPRWSDYLNHGYGYPLFNFAYPFPYYLGAGLVFFGLSYISSVKLLFIISIVTSTVVMFLFIKKLFGKQAAFLSSLVYLIAPYRLTDLYVRGSLGESLSFIYFPLIFYLTWQIYEKFTKPKALLLSVVLTAQILTHNVTALIFIPVWLLLIIFFGKKTLSVFLGIFFLSLCLSAYFLIPALFEKKFIYLSLYRLADLNQYFLSPRDFINNTFGFGWPGVILLIASILILIKGGITKRIRRHFLWLNVFLMLLFLFLTTKWSVFFWQLSPLNNIDFPWRLMGPLSFFGALLTAALAVNRKIYFLSLAFAFFALFQNYRLISPRFIPASDDLYYLTNDATTTSKDEFMPLWVKDKPKNRYREKVTFSSDQARIMNLQYNSHKIDFNIKSLSSGRLKVNTIYYPGWQFTLNGENTPVSYNNPGGLITLDYQAGEHQISGRFRETPLRLIADLISLSAGIYVIITLFKIIFHVSKA